MSNHAGSPKLDAIDSLVDAILDCGSVLSQMIGHMVQTEASGRSAPDAAPIPDVVRALVGDVIADPMRRHSLRDLRMAGTIVEEVTEAMCNDIFFVDPEMVGDPDLN